MNKDKQQWIIYGAVVASGLLAICLPSFCQASNPSSLTVGVNVESSCSISRLSGSDSHSLEIAGGTTSEITGFTLQISCNDADGWRLMAAGWNGYITDSNLVHKNDSSYKIATGTSTGESNPSSWAMKLSDATNATVETGFDNYHEVPGNVSRVAYSDTASYQATITTNYQVYVSMAQTAGEYKGGVRYILEHPAVKADLTSISTMQEMTSQVCSSSTVGQAKQLKDNRDNEYYLVAKLDDGECWMLDNLRLGGSSPMNLTSSNTNIASDYTLPASGTWTGSSQNSYTASYIDATSKDAIATTTYGSGSGKIGNYYNYCAASAGAICTDSNSSNAGSDICPKGWRLPTGGSTGEYQALSAVYSNNSSYFRSSLSIALSGYFSSGVANSQGSSGSFWTSTVYSHASYMYSLTAETTGIDTVGYASRNSGRSIRCIAK